MYPQAMTSTIAANVALDSPEFHSVAGLREPVAMPGPSSVCAFLVAGVGEERKLAKRDKRDTVLEIVFKAEGSVAEPVPNAKNGRESR